jgi:hypothetical protein
MRVKLLNVDRLNEKLNEVNHHYYEPLPLFEVGKIYETAEGIPYPNVKDAYGVIYMVSYEEMEAITWQLVTVRIVTNAFRF